MSANISDKAHGPKKPRKDQNEFKPSKRKRDTLKPPRIKVGTIIPAVTLFEDTSIAREVDLREFCAGKTVVIFALSGASLK
jgi:hypothetical protein